MEKKKETLFFFAKQYCISFRIWPEGELVILLYTTEFTLKLQGDEIFCQHKTVKGLELSKKCICD